MLPETSKLRLSITTLLLFVVSYVNSQNNINSVPADIIVPVTYSGTPARGIRVKQTTTAWANNTSVYHALYLPTNWEKGKKYPVIVEYNGNGPYNNKYGDICDGSVEGCNLGYGLSQGRDFIWVSMPCVNNTSPKSNAINWWGTAKDNGEETKRYTLATIRELSLKYGADTNCVIISGFSRGAVACNYIGLYDDEIAPIWKGFFCHSQYDGTDTTRHFPFADRQSAKNRLNRLNNRPQWISEGGSFKGTKSYIFDTVKTTDTNFTFQAIPYVNHTSIWVLRNSLETIKARKWLYGVVNMGREAGPTLVAPVNNDSITNNRFQVFTWVNIPNAISYEIEIAKDSNFINNVLFTQNLDTNVFVPGLSLPNGSIFWRVRYRDAQNNFSTWSASRRYTIKNIPSITNVKICPSQLPYVWNGLTFSNAGSQTAHIIDNFGYDSAATLNLSIKAASISTTNLSICPSALPFVWNGLTFNSAGSQVAYLVNSIGCDSAATLYLSIKQASISINSDTICSSQLPYVWNGLTFNAAGSQAAHLINSVGCDSAATLKLSIKAASASMINLSICPNALPYVWNGLTFNSSGSQTAHLTNSVGCDSAATLILNVKATLNGAIFVQIPANATLSQIKDSMKSALSCNVPCVLSFAANTTYNLEPTIDDTAYLIDLNNINNLTIEGNNATVVIKNRPYIGFIKLQNSSNVTIRRLKLDWDPLAHSLLDVIAVNKKDTNALNVNVRLCKVGGQSYSNYYPRIDDAAFQKYWSGAYLLNSIKNLNGTVKKNPTITFSIQPNWITPLASCLDTAAPIYNVYVKPSTAGKYFEIGDKFAVINRNGNGGVLNAYNCSNITIDSLTNYSCPMGMYYFYGCDNMKVLNCNADFKDNTRFINSNSYGIQAKLNTNGPLIQNCSFKGLID